MNHHHSNPLINILANTLDIICIGGLTASGLKPYWNDIKGGNFGFIHFAGSFDISLGDVGIMCGILYTVARFYYLVKSKVKAEEK